jgi:hypothetical protein
MYVIVTSGTVSLVVRSTLQSSVANWQFSWRTFQGWEVCLTLLLPVLYRLSSRPAEVVLLAANHVLCTIFIKFSLSPHGGHRGPLRHHRWHLTWRQVQAKISHYQEATPPSWSRSILLKRILKTHWLFRGLIKQFNSITSRVIILPCALLKKNLKGLTRLPAVKSKKNRMSLYTTYFRAINSKKRRIWPKTCLHCCHTLLKIN